MLIEEYREILGNIHLVDDHSIVQLLMGNELLEPFEVSNPVAGLRIIVGADRFHSFEPTEPVGLGITAWLEESDQLSEEHEAGTAIGPDLSDVAQEVHDLLVKLLEREVASQRDVADVDREALDDVLSRWCQLVEVRYVVREHLVRVLRLGLPVERSFFSRSACPLWLIGDTVDTEENFQRLPC